MLVSAGRMERMGVVVRELKKCIDRVSCWCDLSSSVREILGEVDDGDTHTLQFGWTIGVGFWQRRFRLERWFTPIESANQVSAEGIG